MANYEAAARTNAFRVADERKFLEWVEGFDNVEADPSGDGLYVLLETAGSGWPAVRELEEGRVSRMPDGKQVTEWEEEVDFPVELGRHLATGEVAVLMEAGHEKLRYIAGRAVAVNHRGEVLCVDLEDIYEKVAEAGWGEDVREAAY